MNKPANILTAGVTGGELKKKYFGKYKKPLIDTPNLVDHQMKSYKWLLKEGIADVFKEFSPINDYSSKKFQLELSKGPWCDYGKSGCA